MMDENTDETSRSRSEFRNWLEAICKKVDLNSVNHELNISNSFDHNNEDNVYAALNSVEPMINILSKLLLFSNIMNQCFGSPNKVASSSCTEVQIRNVKSYVFNRKKGINRSYLFFLFLNVDLCIYFSTCRYKTR